MRPVVKYLSKNIKEGDKVYVYYSSECAFKYYIKQLNLTGINYAIGISSRKSPAGYIKDLNRFKGTKRLWVIFSHDFNWEGLDEEKFFLGYLKTIGRQVSAFKARGAEIYLFDLR